MPTLVAFGLTHSLLLELVAFNVVDATFVVLSHVELSVFILLSVDGNGHSGDLLLKKKYINDGGK